MALFLRQLQLQMINYYLEQTVAKFMFITLQVFPLLMKFLTSLHCYLLNNLTLLLNKEMMNLGILRVLVRLVRRQDLLNLPGITVLLKFNMQTQAFVS